MWSLIIPLLMVKIVYHRAYHINDYNWGPYEKQFNDYNQSVCVMIVYFMISVVYLFFICWTTFLLYNYDYIIRHFSKILETLIRLKIIVL